MNAQDIAALADRIAEYRRARKVMDFLADATASLSEEDAYKVQFAVHDRLTAELHRAVEQSALRGAPAVIACSPALRPALGRFVRTAAPGAAVLSYREIADHLDVEVIGALTSDPSAGQEPTHVHAVA